jgi:hypothetical protein
MSKEERRVFQFEPGQGFTQVEDKAPVEDTQPKPLEDLPKPEKEGETEVKENDQAIPDAIENTTDNNTGEGPEEEDIQEVNDETPDTNTPDTDISDDGEIDDPTQGDDEEPGGEEIDGEQDGDTEVPQTDDFFVAAATRLKTSGYLPEDFELDENLSEDEADLKIYEAYVEKLKPEANKELLSEFQKEMQKKGWTEQTLEYASMLQNGVRPEDVAVIQDYRTLSSVDKSKMSDEDKEAYIRQMYKDRGWKDKEIKRSLDALVSDEDINSEVEEASSYFAERDKEHTARQKQIAEQNALQQQKVQQYQQAVISHVFNNKEIGGERLTEDQLDVLEEALYTRNIPVQHDGQVYQVSPYEQFQAALNNDFGLKMWAFKKWLFREQEAEQYMQQAQRAAEESQVVKWGKRTKKVKSKEPKEQTNQTGNPDTTTPKTYKSQTNGETYIMEGGQFKRVPK